MEDGVKFWREVLHNQSIDGAAASKLMPCLQLHTFHVSIAGRLLLKFFTILCEL